MACALDLPKIEIFDHVNEIITALRVLRNENGTYSESAQKGNPPDFNFKKKCKLSGHQGEFVLSDEVDHREPPQFISAASRKQCGYKRSKLVGTRTKSEYFSITSNTLPLSY